jgi:hypothetical protein
MNELSTVEASGSPVAFNAAAVFSDPARLQSLMAFAEVMAKSAVTVPKHLAGKASDCLAITLQALRWGMDPYVVAQKTHLVNGTLGYEAQLVVAVLKSSGAVRSRPYYEWVGDGSAMACRAGFIPAGETEIVWTEWLRVSDIQVKNSPLWKTNPRQQMGYLQARNWARLYAPEALLGVYTADELEVLPSTGAPRNLPAADVVEPIKTAALPDYPQADFEKNLPNWRGIVDSGRKSAGDLLAMLQTKASFTPEQEKAILELGRQPEVADDSFVAAMDAAEAAAQ